MSDEIEADECGGCGGTFPADMSPCPRCGRPHDLMEDLEALVKEWRDFADVSGWDGYSQGVREATEACADELAEVLDDE